MKIIFSYEENEVGRVYRSRFHRAAQYAARGFVVVQHEPQARTLWFAHRPVRVNFPYLIQFISYKKLGNDFVWNGIYDGGLAAYFSSKPISSVQDKISVSYASHHPFEKNGFLCSDHVLDGSQFSSINDLVLFVHDLFLRTMIPGDNHNWRNKTEEEILKGNWRTSNFTIQQILNFFLRFPCDTQAWEHAIIEPQYFVRNESIDDNLPLLDIPINKPVLKLDLPALSIKEPEKRKIDWGKVWQIFGDWCDTQKEYPIWEEQQLRLQKIINGCKNENFYIPFQKIWKEYEEWFSSLEVVPWYVQQNFIMRSVDEKI